MSEAGRNGAVAVGDGATAAIGSPGTVGKLFVSEVAPWASGDSPVGADWFEVTNSTGLAIDLTGWKVDDNSQSPIAAVALAGVEEIAAGESVIFVNGGAAEVQAFITTWFGGKLPNGVQIGTYTGSGIGLSTGGDQVNLYDAANILRASVSFGQSTALPSLATFDNAAGLTGAITRISTIGSNGAYQVATANGTETGSPGSIRTIVDDSNVAPSAISLANALGSIDENSATLNRIKVADIAVVDDGRGTNALGLTGSDAAFFEVDANGLYLKAGTNLDYESKTSYAVTVTVDDPTVGATPDAATDYVLNVRDITNEGSGPAIRITEVAPWASGDSPVRADWFELTNFSDATVDIAGWRVDDDSNSSAASVALSGVTSIAAGQSVIFLQTTDLATTAKAFVDTWFGGQAPAGLTFGSYTGSGIGLSGGGDAVVLFDAAGNVAANVTFGASTGVPALATFDNAAGLNNARLITIATAGVDGAFTVPGSTGNSETGSPGYIAPSRIAGGAGDDVLDGTVLADLIVGGAGNDTLSGMAGNDRLIGGAGSDTMRGGTGADAFFFSIDDNGLSRGRAQTLDRILDFSSEDVLVTDVALFDSDGNGVVTFGRNKLLDLTGGGQVSIIGANGKRVIALEYDGIWRDKATGIDHYVYSLVGSAAGVATLDLSA